MKNLNGTKVLGISAMVLAVLATVSRPAIAQQAAPEEIAAAIARPAVVHVTVRWHGWVRDRLTGEVFGGATGYDATTSCAGAVVNPDGYVATVSRCVHTGLTGGSGALFDLAIADLAKAGRIGDAAKARQALADHALAEGAVPDTPVDRQIQVERALPDGQRDVAPATVVDLVAPTDGDVAVLKIPRDHLPAVEPRTDQAAAGTPVVAIGYPAAPEPNLAPSNRNGQISAQRTVQGRPFYELSGGIDGLTGGPVVDLRGRLVGLVSQPGDHLAAAAQTLMDVLRDKGIEATLGVHDRNYRTGLDRYFAGDLDGAVEYFDAVLAAAPANAAAAEYRRMAIERGGAAGAGTTLLVTFAIACGGVAVLAAAAAAVLLGIGRRRRALSAMDTPPSGIPSVPVGLGVQPEPDGQADPDKTEQRERAGEDDQTEYQAGR
jgi:serine protease Do